MTIIEEIERRNSGRDQIMRDIMQEKNKERKEESTCEKFLASVVDRSDFSDSTNHNFLTSAVSKNHF